MTTSTVSVAEANPPIWSSAARDLGRIVRSPAFWPAAAFAVAVAVLFWDFWGVLYELYSDKDGYYSHGFIVPIIAAYAVHRNWKTGGLAYRFANWARSLARLKPWQNIAEVPPRAFWPALILLAATLWMSLLAGRMSIEAIRSLTLIFILLFSIWSLAGFRWMAAVSDAVLYLAFALPLWRTFINDYTNPLQIWSTKVAFQLLRLVGFEPYMDQPTIIYLNQFTLDVGVPCSGLKLLLALTAFTVFFLMIARLSWLGNLVMLILIVPLSLLVNGLRIALIGIVGNQYGPQAGNQFHDWSGYLTLVVCFIIVFKVAKILGWKD